MGIRLVVGLGNPGDKYRDTRHNAGFMALDRLIGPEDARDWRGLGLAAKRAFSGGEEVHLAKPMTFMNESGRMVGELSRFYKLQPSEVLIVYDDFAIPLGRLRLRKGGSAGGHNGMQSVVDHLGTPEVPRLRIGIGPLPPGTEDSARFVLTRFGPSEKGPAAEALDAAAEAVRLTVERGLEAAMNRFNVDAPEPLA